MMSKSNITNFPKLNQIQFISRDAAGDMTTPKKISLEEFNQFSGQDPIEWEEGVILDPHYQGELPELSIKHFPSKGSSYVRKIQEAVAKTVSHLALIHANEIFGFSTITTKRFAAGELCLLYSGQYFPTENKPDIYTIEIIDKNEQHSGIIDAKYFRGFGAFMASAPTKKKEHNDILSLEDYEFGEMNKKKIAQANVTRIKNFSFNKIPYIVYSNPNPIEPFTLLASNYGNHYFRKHDIIPALSDSNGMLLDTSLYASKNIEFEFLQASGPVVCHVARSGISMVSALSQGLKFHVNKNIIYFIPPQILFSLFNKYPQHSPFIRVEEDEFVIMNV